MLKLKYHDVEKYDLARCALKHWEYDKENLDETLARFRISSSVVYPFFQHGQPCLMRLVPTDERRLQNVVGGLEFIEYLRANGYPAPDPVPSTEGRLNLKLCGRWGEYYASVFRTTGGIPLENALLSENTVYEYGKTLGWLHKLSSDFTPKTRKQDHLDILEWTRAMLIAYNAPGYMTGELKSVAAALAKLPVNDVNYGLVHFDYSLNSVCCDTDDGKLSVINFDNCMYNWYAVDVLTAFDAITGRFDGAGLAEAKRTFERGYASERAFPEGIEELTPLLHRFTDIYQYAGLIRCSGRDTVNESQRTAVLRGKIEAALREKEHSIAG